MLFPVHRLATDADGRPSLTRGPQRAWQPLVVVPRAWCVAEVLPARQVRWWEQAGFASLQAKRLAPFPDTGGSASVRGGQLRLWLWDQSEVEAALADAPPALRRARRVAQAQLDESSASRFGPWNRDLLAARTAAGADRGPRAAGFATALGAAALLGTGAYAAYWWAAASAAETRLAELQTQAGERGAQVAALTALSRAEQADRDELVVGEWTSLAVEVAGEVAGDVVCHLDEHGAIAEIGYTFRRQFQGKGYAREAAGALVDHILATTSVHRIEASLDPDNVPSMRVLESIGMTFELAIEPWGLGSGPAFGGVGDLE